MAEKNNVNAGKKVSSKFSIIDLLMIIMVVGVILTIILPLRQARIHESLVRESMNEMYKVIRANDYFKQYSGWQTYAVHIDQLVIDNLNTSVFTFAINDTSIIATTEQLGRTEKAYWFDLRDRRIKVREDSKDTIVDAWLPSRINETE